MKELGLGTLGLSGKYRKIAKSQILEELSAIRPEKFSFVDWGYVYDENGHNILSYLSRDDNWRFKKLTLKILRLNPVTYRKGIEQINNSLFFGWKGQIEIMFHNPCVENYILYKQFVSKFRKNLNNENIKFGICINNINQLNIFSDLIDLETIQLPYNLIDHNKFDLILKKSKIYGLKNQVRSILGGGLFNGLNNLDSASNIDSIRSQWVSSSALNHNRFERFLKIKNEYFEKNNFQSKNDIVDLMYSFIMNIKEIDSVISGAYTSEKINFFSSFFSTDSNKNIYNNFLKKDFKT